MFNENQKNSNSKIKIDYPVCSPVFTHSTCSDDKYHPLDNPNGKINFSTALNTVISKSFEKFLPSELTYENLCYERLEGQIEFRQICVKNTIFEIEETCTSNSLESVLDAIFHIYPKISTNSNEELLHPILDDSKSKIVDFSDSQCHLYFYDNENFEWEKFNSFCQDYQGESVIIVSRKKTDFSKIYLNNSSYCIPTMIEKVSIAYNWDFTENVSLGVFNSKNKSLMEKIIKNNWFYPVSTLIQAMVMKDLHNLPILDDITNVYTSIIKMFQAENLYEVSNENIFLTTGASNALDTLAKTCFEVGDIIVLESPFYTGFSKDFSRSGVILEPNHYNKNINLITKVRRAYEDGAKGFLTSNPHNPTGIIYSAEEIEEACEFVADKNFKLIFDELYANSVFSSKSFYSGIPFAILNKNVYVVRGFAKDYGLSGFKVGICITSDENVKSKMKLWQRICAPQSVVLSLINHILEHTNYGKDVYKENKIILGRAMDLSMRCLDRMNISYLKPEGGVFIFANFGEILKRHPYMNEYLIWYHLLYDYGVGIVPGKLYHSLEDGWVRICPIYDEDVIKEGFKRIELFFNHYLELH